MHITELSVVRNRVVEVAQEFTDAPFRHHYRPEDTCNGGRYTNNDCMYRGMDVLNGFDCSGLIIASVCKAIGVPTSDWSMTYRHVVQLEKLAHYRDPLPGDAILFADTKKVRRVHSGICIKDTVVVHASGLEKELRVVEGIVTGYNDPPKTVSLQTMVNFLIADPK